MNEARARGEGEGGAGPAVLPVRRRCAPLARPEMVIALAVSLLPVVLLGRMHADEVYQWLEPAFVRAHGYGDLGWEWSVGIRNWALPMLFSWLLRAGAWVGLADPVAARALIAIPHVILTALMLAAVRRWVDRRGGPERALLAVWLLGTYGLFILFAGRSMAETYSAAALVLAADAVDREKAFSAGAWMGLSIVFRYPSVVLVAGMAIAVLAWNRRLLWGVLAGGGVVVALLGLLDWATWGRPYHSFITWLRFNVLSSRGVEAFGAQPLSQYAPYLGRVAPWIWAGAFWSWRKRISGRWLLFPVAIYVVVLLATPHKEGRFLYPAIILLALFALPGWFALVGAATRPGLGRVLLVAGFLVSPTSYFLFQKSLRGDLFRAVVRAGRRPDVTGLLVAGAGRWDVAGYFFVGKHVPYEICADEATCAALLAQPRFDYVVATRPWAAELALRHGFEPFRPGKSPLLRRPPHGSRPAVNDTLN